MYCKDYAGASPGQIGCILLVANLLGIPIGLLLGTVCDRFRCHRLAYMVSLCISLLCYIILVIPLRAQSKLESKLQGPNEWFFIVATIYVIGNISLTFQYNIVEMLCANIASQTGKSYGHLRVWGGVGYVATSLTIYFIDPLTESFARLSPHFGLLLMSTFVMLMLVVLWPNEEIFDLSDNKTEIEFKFSKGMRSRHTISSCKSEMKTTEIIRDDSIFMTTANITLTFDSDCLIQPRKMTRYSITPLDSSYWIYKGELDERVSGYYSHVTKIAPLPNLKTPSSDEQTKKEIKLTTTDHYDDRTCLVESSDEKPGFSFNIRMLWLILKRDSLLLRFLLIYAIVGLAESLCSNYIVEFMNHLNHEEAVKLSALMIASAGGSEAIFYLLSHHVTTHLSPSNALSLVMFAFGVRFALYLPFLLPNQPLFLLVFVEMLQSVTFGLFNCVFYVLPIDFSSRGLNLISGIIQESSSHANSKSREDIIRNGLKFSMMSISSCFFDGFGYGFGSQIGGHIIEVYGFPALWILAASIMFLVSIVNIVFDIKDGHP